MTISNAFEKKFVSLGGTITSKEIVQANEADMKLPVTKVINEKPQAIFLGTYYQFVKSTKIIHDLGYKGKLYSIEVDDYLTTQTSQWIADLQFIAPDYYVGDFVDAFKNKFGRAPGMPAGQTYDATKILFSLLNKTESKNELLEYMKSFSGHDGVSGHLQIESDGRTSLPTALFELKRGQVSRVMLLK